MDARTYSLDDGHTLRVAILPTGWLVLLEGDANAQAVGWPLQDLVAEVGFGIEIVHDDIPQTVIDFAQRIRDDFPRADWPAVPRP